MPQGVVVIAVPEGSALAVVVCDPVECHGRAELIGLLGLVDHFASLSGTKAMNLPQR